MTTTPNARVILPAEATATQGDAIIDGYSSMVSASPNAGSVTAEMLEAASASHG